ncbi:helix-turn-helix transcriptional regulator [Kiloniella majae]|uniref:helix-turn-helix transcriptional regulator n=1 Tax=Kiloniella majae TaxID=1938558 RepID=UPI000A2789CB|nr:LuxR C-terminal-related transcriptional regulator [Kiloniella majae]
MSLTNDLTSFFILGELDMIKKFIADEVGMAFPDSKVFINRGNDIHLPYNYTEFPHCILYISATLSKNCLLKIASIKQNSSAKIILITDEKTGPSHILNTVEVEAIYSINKPIDGLFNLIQQSFSMDTSQKNEILHSDEGLFSDIKLTTTEIQILTLLKTGMSNKEIANITKKSEGTVKVQLKSIYKKLNIHSRTEAMNLFIA